MIQKAFNKMVVIKLVIVCFLLLSHNSLYGQYLNLDSIQILPENATLEDTIRLRIVLEFPYTESNLNNYSIEVLEDESKIMIETCYYMGLSASPSTSTDTIEIGVLEDEEYQINFAANTVGLQGANCNNQSLSDTFQFIIQTSSGDILSNVNTTNQKIYTSISLLNKLIEQKLEIQNKRQDEVLVEIYNLFGHRISYTTIEGIGVHSIDLSSLNSSTYICTFSANKKFLNSVKFVKL